MQKVLRVDQSPMNALRWCLQLECGHDNWVTATKRPTRKTKRCDICEPKSAIAKAERGIAALPFAALLAAVGLGALIAEVLR